MPHCQQQWLTGQSAKQGKTQVNKRCEAFKNNATIFCCLDVLARGGEKNIPFLTPSKKTFLNRHSLLKILILSPNTGVREGGKMLWERTEIKYENRSTVCILAHGHNKMNSLAPRLWSMWKRLPPALKSVVAYLSWQSDTFVGVCWRAIDHLVIGGVVVGAGTANRAAIWESGNADHSPVMDKVALCTCHFKSAEALLHLQLWLSQMRNRHGALYICRQQAKHSTPLAL